jgi:hypothetical protein
MRLSEYEAFETSKTPDTVVMKSNAMAAAAVVGLVVSGTDGFAAGVQTSIRKDGLA